MANNLIILVHGMGTYEPGQMTKEVQAGLDKSLEFAGLNFDYMQDVEFYEHNYGILLDGIRKKESEALSEFSQLGINTGVIAKLNDYATNLSGDKFFYSHLLDVIYYGLTMWGERLRSNFINDLIAQKRAGLFQGKRIHILGYSLGTALINDSLSKIYRDGDGDEQHFSTDHDKIEKYWSIANVSRIIHGLNDINGADPKTNVVTDNIGGCIKKMTVAAHKYDPFMLVKPYERVPVNGRFHHPSGITQANTHDLTGYLAHPEIGLNLIYDLYSTESGIDANNLASAIDKHKATTFNSDLANLQTLWDDLVDSIDAPIIAIDNAINLIDSVKAYQQRIESLLFADNLVSMMPGDNI
ncbi:hypothetical protein [Paraglaciecola arctica]|uniref:Uncharacterized protein n=1 Tax=Paraglaciecola arctica BSs20135 TaxID=493475 RepID=K6YM22_9ALTE|nr:hypothetical protein [Paraglaciecola arctica]GAC17693.1 hypothetical protein GARC_0712 [Paraglaciecola arctica BSs20135]